MENILGIFELFSTKEKDMAKLPTLSEVIVTFEDKEETRELYDLIKSLRYYISTPWSQKPSGEWGPIDSYKVYEWGQQQSHGGDLFHHSIWCGQWVEHWLKVNSSLEGEVYDCNALLKDIGPAGQNIVLLSAYLHDIGKGGDNIFDLYSGDKYEKQGESVHPDFSLDYILGLRKYSIADVRVEKQSVEGNKEGQGENPHIVFLKKWLPVDAGTSGPNKTKNESYLSFKEFEEEIHEANKNIDLKNMLINLGINELDIKKLALISGMHWEFGKLNIEKGRGGYGGDPNEYLKVLNEHINKINKNTHGDKLVIDQNLVKQCIIVSCADICGSRPPDILHQKPDSEENWKLRCKYNTKTPWTAFGMDVKHTEYIKSVINTFLELEKNKFLTWEPGQGHTGGRSARKLKKKRRKKNTKKRNSRRKTKKRNSRRNTKKKNSRRNTKKRNSRRKN